MRAMGVDDNGNVLVDHLANSQHMAALVDDVLPSGHLGFDPLRPGLGFVLCAERCALGVITIAADADVPSAVALLVCRHLQRPPATACCSAAGGWHWLITTA